MAGALVRVPYIFKATIRRPRKRTDDEVGYLGMVDVVVPGVDPDDAPVVLHGVTGTYRPLPPHRFHDGGLWVPSTDGRDGEGRVRGAAWLDGDPGRDVSYHPLFRKTASYSEHRMGPAVPRDSDPNVKEVLSDDEAQVLGEVRAGARRFLLVGDEVWVRAAEPVYDISRHMFDRDHVSVSGFDGGRDQYRLDQGHWIADVDWSTSGREGGRDRPEVALLRPDLLRARTTEHSVKWTCEHLVGALYEKLRGGSVDDFAAYARLRDSTRDMGKSLERGEPVDLASMASDLSDAMEALARLDLEASGHGVDYDRKYVDNALGRIERELAAPTHEELPGFRP